MKFSLGVRLLTLSVLTVLAGCGGGGALGLGGGGGTTCSPTSYNITYPATNGFSASGSINSASGCFSTATVTSNAAIIPVIGSPYVPSAGTVLAYFGVTFSVNEYATGLPSLTVTLPAGTLTAGHSFYLAHNGSQGSALGWTGAVAGPVTASGSTVSFPNSGGNITFFANQEDELALYEI